MLKTNLCSHQPLLWRNGSITLQSTGWLSLCPTAPLEFSLMIKREFSNRLIAPFSTKANIGMIRVSSVKILKFQGMRNVQKVCLTNFNSLECSPTTWLTANNVNIVEFPISLSSDRKLRLRSRNGERQTSVWSLSWTTKRFRLSSNQRPKSPLQNTRSSPMLTKVGWRKHCTRTKSIRRMTQPW